MEITLALIVGLLVVGAGVLLAAVAVLHPDPEVRRRARAVLALILMGGRPS